MAKNIVRFIMDQNLSTILVETMELVSGAKKIDYISIERKYYQKNKRKKNGETNMEKYIKADTVLKFINGCLEHEDKITDTEKAVLTGVKTCIERIPAADVMEVRHGRWIWKGHYLICSECDHESDRTNYCPNCGAKMDGEENE